MRRMLTVAALVLAVGGAAAAAAAEPGLPLRADLAVLEAEAAAVRQVQLAQLQAPVTRPAAAGLEARVARLEEDLRRLNGRIEEVEFAQRQAQARMDRLVADLDARLGGIGAGGGPASAAPQPPSPPPPPTAAAAPARPQPLATAPAGRGLDQPPVAPLARPAVPQAPAMSTVEPDASARRGYVLGTIPEDALRGAPPPPKTLNLPAPGQPAPGSQAKLEPEGATDAAAYLRGLDLLQAGNWAGAEQAFTAFVQANPSDPRAATASYWIGETHYFRKDYSTAAAVFARNYRTYGESAPRAPDNLLKLGMALAAMGDRAKACQSFAELAKRHPNAPAPIRQALSRERSSAGCS